MNAKVPCNIWLHFQELADLLTKTIKVTFRLLNHEFFPNQEDIEALALHGLAIVSP